MKKALKRTTIFLTAAAAMCCAAGFVALSSATTTEVAAAETLKGEGTYSSPYIIDDADDLFLFASSVNGGNDYTGQYVKQTADIDLENEDFTPIGVCGGGNYFGGTYLGAGHTIYNLSVSAKNDLGGAFFGTLEGSVYSLAIRGGSVSGTAAAGIAAKGAGENAIIADCLTEITLSGKRTAGIADDFAEGSILGCVSLSVTENGSPSALCSYSAGKIRFSYSAGEIFTGSFCDHAEDNHPFAKNLISRADFYITLNKNNGILYKENALSSALANYGRDLSFIADNSETNLFFTAGDGSKYNPYKLATPNDLTDLSIYVNGGEGFRKVYFQQVENIDMTGADFIPIGIYGEGNYFYGYYDGGGHTISGLNITTTRGKANNGLFGTLGGKVVNLGLTDGYIKGNCCGSFASHATDSSTIIANCYSTLTIRGTRSGGIADNFLGTIAGCWYYNDNLALPIISYNAKSVKYCHNNYLYILPETFEGTELSNFCIEMKIFSQDDFKNTINGNLSFISYELGMNLSEFTKCYSTDYANGFEQMFTYPRQTFLAFRLYLEAAAVMAASAAVVAITLVIQYKKGRKKQNESN